MQLTRFLIVGGFSTIVNYLIFYILYELNDFDHSIASGVGYISGLILGYIFNKHWTFESRDSSHKKMIPYAIVYISSLVLSLLLLELLVRNSINAKIANIICILLTTCTNFIGSKYIVFNEGRND